MRYRSGEDLGLDMHTDDSDVTFNLCLGLEFTGAGLQFCGMAGAADHRKHRHSYFHRKAGGSFQGLFGGQGRCVMHLGRRRHGADDITSGERLNLILWNHSSTYRSSEESESPEYIVESGALKLSKRLKEVERRLARSSGRGVRELHARPGLRPLQGVSQGQGALPRTRLVPAKESGVSRRACDMLAARASQDSSPIVLASKLFVALL